MDGVRGRRLNACPRGSAAEAREERALALPHRSSGSREPGGDAPGSRWGRKGSIDSPAAPREPQLRSASAQLRAGPDAAPAAGGGAAASSSASEQPCSPAPPLRLQPASSTAPAASSVASFLRFF
uniref:Uncharacterized protein n=1 Tax=Mus musculus TaxID=10090 RepID=Q3UR58_MOUSE|nr:unnamed protein product [Mus musculus]